MKPENLSPDQLLSSLRFKIGAILGEPMARNEKNLYLGLKRAMLTVHAKMPKGTILFCPLRQPYYGQIVFSAYMEDNMSKECDFCGKKPQVGNLVSHSNIKTKRRFNPNLQRVRHQFPDGSVRTLTICTRCLRCGLVSKPTVRKPD